MPKTIVVITSALLKFQARGDTWTSTSNPETGATRVFVEQDGKPVAVFPEVHAVYDEVSAELVTEDD